MAVGLTKILPKALVNEVVGNPDIEVEQLTFNSRVAGANSCFFAIRGTQADGHRFIPQAVENGASAIVCEAMPVSFAPNVTYVRVSDSSEALGLMASAFYGNPSSNLKLVGVTGTNGKTTTATLLYRIVGMLGFKAGLLSTVVNQVVDEQIPTTHTTPDPIELNRLLRRMVDAGCSYCFMEVSSHAVVQKR
ncbi:MAG TPA: Mur ligase family protein, partial [Tenuifilaceae bacterium]|nr:Mur ligase family protein [Tenuifilaceae bacterium]